MSKKKFTDNQLTHLYLSLSRDFKVLKKQKLPLVKIHDTLATRIQTALNNKENKLHGLDEEEQRKVYSVLNALIKASPDYRNLTEEEEPPKFMDEPFQKSMPISIILIKNAPSRDYYSMDDAFFTWMLYDSLMQLHMTSHCSIPSTCNSKTDLDRCTGDSVSNSEALALLAIVALVAIAAILTIIAFSYIMYEMIQSMERFVYSEGWFYATLTLASMAAGGAAGGLLTAFFLTNLVMGLALAAGISNPIGLSIFAIVCVSIISAAAAGLLTNFVQDLVITKTRKDSIDPHDPYRYTLTSKEEDHLIEKGLDPIQVKCAIVALREQLGKKGLPCFITRHLTKEGKKKQEILDQIRHLRAGNVEDGLITVGDFIFNLHKTCCNEPVYSKSLPDEDDLTSESLCFS